MKRFIINYILYIYNTFIVNDHLDVVKKGAIPFIKASIFMSNIYSWILSIVLFPFFVIDMKMKQNINFNKLKNILN